MQEDKSFLGTQPIKKLLPKLAVPTVIAQLVNMLYNIVGPHIHRAHPRGR